MTSPGCGKAVHGDEAKRRRAVDEDEVEVVHDGVDGPLQFHLPAEGRNQLDLYSGQVDRGRCHKEVLHAGRLDAVLQRLIPHDHVIHRELEVPGIDTQTGRRIPLGIQIDDEHPVADLSQGRAEVDRRRGLPDATLLVGDCDHPRELPRCRTRTIEKTVGFGPDGRRPHLRTRGLLGNDRSGGCDRDRLRYRSGYWTWCGVWCRSGRGLRCHNGFGHGASNGNIRHRSRGGTASGVGGRGSSGTSASTGDDTRGGAWATSGVGGGVGASRAWSNGGGVEAGCTASVSRSIAGDGGVAVRIRSSNGWPEGSTASTAGARVGSPLSRRRIRIKQSHQFAVSHCLSWPADRP